MSSALLWSLSIGEPGVLQTPARRREELARDLAAAGEGGDRSVDICACVTKPTVLRRLASLLTERVCDADRIASRQGARVALAAALALQTGLPFVVVRQAEILGELHPGERVLLLEDRVEARPTREALAALRKAGAAPIGVLAVLGDQHVGTVGGEDELGFEALFTDAELPTGTHPLLPPTIGIREEDRR